MEQVFSILKNCFRILFYEMKYTKWDPIWVIRLIMAICTLYNFIVHEEGLEDNEYMKRNRAPEFEFEREKNVLLDNNIDELDEGAENERDNVTRDIFYHPLQWKIQV